MERLRSWIHSLCAYTSKISRGAPVVVTLVVTSALCENHICGAALDFERLLFVWTIFPRENCKTFVVAVLVGGIALIAISAGAREVHISAGQLPLMQGTRQIMLQTLRALKQGDL